MPKHERVVAAAQAADPPCEWELTRAGDEGTDIVLLRGDESMSISWDSKDGLVHPLAYSLSGVKDIQLRNVAEAIRVIGDKPNYKKKASGPRREAKTVETARRAPLPFDIVEATDEEIIKAVRGKQLVWLNDTAQEYETATVPDRKKVLVPDPAKPGEKKVVWRTSRNITLRVTSTGRRVLTFPAVGEQYRSLGLDTLVQVR